MAPMSRRRPHEPVVWLRLSSHGQDSGGVNQEVEKELRHRAEAPFVPDLPSYLSHELSI